MWYNLGMKYKVYHNSRFLEHGGLSWGTKEFPNWDCLNLVAFVEAETIDNVYRLTNHIDDLWWENPEVEVVKNSRSTSCGDVVEDPQGRLWVCAAVGWVEWKQ